MPTEFENLAKATGKAIETVPEIYNDGLKQVTQESGKILAIIPQTINAALLPLRKWNIQREYNYKETEKLLAQKLEQVSPDKIVTPESYVAVPAIQAISYSMDSKELRNLYANLLSKAMNIDTKSQVHPSYVEIIKQFSPLDAKVFNLIYNAEMQPIIDLGITFPDPGGSKNVFTNISWITDYPRKQLSISFDNLERLKLIDISNDTYTFKENYNLVHTTSEYNMCKTLIEQALKPGQSLKETEKVIYITNLGESFYKTCMD